MEKSQGYPVPATLLSEKEERKKLVTVATMAIHNFV